MEYDPEEPTVWAKNTRTAGFFRRTGNRKGSVWHGRNKGVRAFH